MKQRENGFLAVDGDVLAYRVTGDGAPLLLIAGGGGDGDLFLPLADQLSPAYKVITYDRRANAGSTIHHPDEFSIAQQAKDAAAILDQIGESSAFIFGNSSGAVIAIEMLRLFPERVNGAIVHEPPIVGVHPQKDVWLTFFQKCYAASFKPGGAAMAAARFFFGIEVPALRMIAAQARAEKYLKNNHIHKERKVSSRQASKYLVQQELLPTVCYTVDPQPIKSIWTRWFWRLGNMRKTGIPFCTRSLCSSQKPLAFLLWPFRGTMGLLWMMQKIGPARSTGS